jgi:hypothetical protein
MWVGPDVMSSDIRLLGRSEYDRASAFLNAHWQKNHIYCRDRSLFEWTFGQNPYWQDFDNFSVSMANAGDTDIGFLGIIPFSLNYHGKSKPACWLVNWKVRDDCRGTGAGLKLLKVFKDMGFVTVSFGINDIIARLYRGLGWDLIDNIPRLLWVCPNAMERLRDLCALCGENIALDDLSALTSRTATENPVPHMMTLGDVSDSDWDTKGWTPHAENLTCCAREYRYLKWRYLQHPSFEYRTALLPEGDRIGMAAWRVETIHHRTMDGTIIPVDRIVRLVELLPTSAANMKTLLGKVRSDAIAVDAMAIDFYSYNSTFNAWAEEAGFVVVNRLPFGNALPSRFQPLDNKGGVIPSAVKVGLEPPSCQSPCDWHWTRADSDQDRPNM